MWASRRENTKPARRNESKVGSVKAFPRPEIPSRTERAHPGGVPRVERVRGTDTEPTRWDPKDGDLCLTRSKPGETLVEDRSDSDVQIDRPSWVYGRKTNRTI